jgi:hypothetical protein
MKRLSRWIVPALLLLGVVACGPPRKSVFPPMVSVQQLQVQADGSWRMQLRIQNNSYGATEYTGLHLAMQVGRQPAGTIDQTIDLKIPALSVDVVTVVLKPAANAATALRAVDGDGGADAVSYNLKGKVDGVPEHEKKPREFEVGSDDWLSPVPGIAHTYR